MAYPLNRSRTLLAILAAVVLQSSGGCSALRLWSELAGGGGRSGLTPPPAPLNPSVLGNAGDSVFRVVAWSMAIVAGSLVLAFVARLLNHRTKTERSGSPGPAYNAPPTIVGPRPKES